MNALRLLESRTQVNVPEEPSLVGCLVRASNCVLVSLLVLGAGCSSPRYTTPRPTVLARVAFGQPAMAFCRLDDTQDAEVRVAISGAGDLHLAWKTTTPIGSEPDRTSRFDYAIVHTSANLSTLYFSPPMQVSLPENNVECDPCLIVVQREPWVAYLSSKKSYLARKPATENRWQVRPLHGDELRTDLPIPRAYGSGGALLACTTWLEKGSGLALLHLDAPLASAAKVIPLPQIARCVYLRDIALLSDDRVALAIMIWHAEEERREYRILIANPRTGDIVRNFAVPCEKARVAFRYKLNEQWGDCEGVPGIVAFGSKLCTYWVSQDDQWRFSLVFSVIDWVKGDAWGNVQTVYVESGRKIILHAAAVDPNGGLHFSWLSQSEDRLWNAHYARTLDWIRVDSLQALCPDAFPIEAWPGFSGNMAVDEKNVYLAWPMSSKGMRGVMICVGRHSQ